MPSLLVLQHIACEHLGLIELLLKDRGVEFHYLRPFAGEPVPNDLAGWDALIALGGPMSANDGDRPGFMADELLLLVKAFGKGMPVLGVCLGAQLIAKAAGASVWAAPQKEIGWYPLTLTEEGKRDRLLAGLPDIFPVFQWHGETFSIPRGGTRLAESERYPNQAFRLGERVYGLQFHLETTAPMIGEWLDLYRDEYATCGATVQDRSTVLAGTAAHGAEAEQRARDVFGRFLNLIV